MEFRRKLKDEWKRLWRERFDDKVRAEGIAAKNYPLLYVERGTVIVATRKYKPPSFSEIVKFWAENFKIFEESRISPPHPSVGGWRKFIKTHPTKHKSTRRNAYEEEKQKKAKLQLKKGGRGWLHSF